MSRTHHGATQSANKSGPSSTHESHQVDDNPSSTTSSTSLQAPLPPHWEEIVSSDGRTYYANHANRSTSWLRPDAEMEGYGSNTQEGLPPAWQELVDGDGRTYYANHESRTSTLDRPEGLVGELPAGWELLRNAEGVAYFADHNTRTTAWSAPRDHVSG